MGSTCLLVADVLPEPVQIDLTTEGKKVSSLTPQVNGIAAQAINGFDNVQAGLSTNFLAAVDRLDRIFGDERLIDDTDISRMTLGVGVQVSRFDGITFKHKTQARISLPRTRNRIMLEFSQETEAEDIDKTSQIRSAYKDTTPDFGLRLKLFNREITHITASAGLRLDSPLQGYGRLRASRTFLLNPETSFYVAQKLQYYTEDRWSETSSLRLSQCIFDCWVLESLVSLTWREREPGCEPYLMFSFMHEHKEKRAVRFDVGAAWPETPHTRESRYFVQGTRRRQLGRRWLFGEIRLGVAFPEKEDFAPDPFVRMMVEMTFGK